MPKRNSLKYQLLLMSLPIFIAFSSKTLSPESPPRAEWIVWNVGQGLWTTWVSGNECWHFDMGGEYKILPRVFAKCQNSLNRIYLSHWDFDHIGFLKEVKKKSWALCLAQEPGGKPTPAKFKLIEGLKACPNQASVKLLWDSPHKDQALKISLKNRSNNHDSHVFEIKPAQVLVTGDSTVDEEKIWSTKVSPQIRGLVLGHHGSRTSSSDELLSRLPQLRWAVASQRFARYGHPHQEVVARLRKRKIPLLRTEDWGTLHFLE
jgi:competence protein ComEC